MINIIKGVGKESEISMTGEYIEKPWPKTVAGIRIPEEDKDRMILKLIVDSRTTVEFMHFQNYGVFYGEVKEEVRIDYGNGRTGRITDYYIGESVVYEPRRVYNKIGKYYRLFVY